MVAPDDPADTWVDEAVLVARAVDRLDPPDPEVPVEIGVEERCDHRAGRAVDVDGHVHVSRRLERVERASDPCDVLVGAVVGRAEHRDDADGVVIAALRRPVERQVGGVGTHVDQASLDVEVAAELLPAHLNVGAHDEVRGGGVLTRGMASVPPPVLEGQTSEHARLARARRRAACGLFVTGGIPQRGEHVDAPPFELRDLRILVLVDHVLGGALGHQRGRLGLHPRREECREVEPCVPIQHQLVMDDLVCAGRRDAAVGEP